MANILVPTITSNLDSLRRDLDVSKEIIRTTPDATPFTIMMLKSRKKPTKTAEFYWWEEDCFAYWTKINKSAGYTDSDVKFAVDDYTIFAINDLVKVPRTGEVLLVTKVESTGITCTRAFGETAAAALVNDDDLVVLGNAMEERSSVPGEKTVQPTKLYNYTQIVRTPFGISGTLDAEQQVTNEQERQRLTKSKSIDHKLQLERIMMFGERKQDTSSGKRQTTRGVEKFIATNVYDAGGVLTEAEFDLNVCEPVFKYGEPTKVLVASRRMLSIMNGWGKEKLQVSQGAKAYGLNLTEYVSPHGTLLIAPSRTLEQYYAYHSFVIDMKYVEYKPLRDTALRRNIQANDVDGFLDEYMTEFGLKFQMEKAHMMIKNATA
jgi:hypothetical protein